MENGSGGMLSDIEFNGGKFGVWVGNQQYVSPIEASTHSNRIKPDSLFATSRLPMPKRVFLLSGTGDGLGKELRSATARYDIG